MMVCEHCVLWEALHIYKWQLAKWRPRRVNVIILFKSNSLKTRSVDGISFCLTLSPKSEGWCLSSKTVRESEFSLTLPFCFMQAFSGLSEAYSLEWAICFTQSTNSNANLIQKHTHGHNQNNFWANSWAPCGLVKLTHKINHHASCMCISMRERTLLYFF